MKICLVCYEELEYGIIGKFAKKMHSELIDLGVDVSIKSEIDPNADINHHLVYLGFKTGKSKLDTLMVTHVDSMAKVNLLKKQVSDGAVGICMSFETMANMVNYNIDKDRLCVINPAQDDVIRPRKLVIGITSKLYNDGRKEEGAIKKIVKEINHDDYKFVIMGSGWNDIILEMRESGFEVDYYEQFDYEKYTQIVPVFDYYLYVGHDEGSMGYLDALAADVQTVVTPQGYHLDVENGINYSIDNYKDVISVFKGISRKRAYRVGRIKELTWKNYAKKHLEIWEHLLEGSSESSFNSVDGLNSLMSDKQRASHKIKIKIFIKSIKYFIAKKLGKNGTN